MFLTGCVGPMGPTGATGPQGAVGIGTTGPSGADGTVITVVQFCPGTPTYPSVFPETGLCINNRIYAVYSMLNAFLTEVTPGLYNSTGVGSSCNFEVDENCVVISK